MSDNASTRTTTPFRGMTLPSTQLPYRDVLLTYSNHRALPPGDQSGLLDCITDLIENSHGGRITKRYMTELRMARTSARAH